MWIAYGIMSQDIIRAEVRIETTYYVRSTWYTNVSLNIGGENRDSIEDNLKHCIYYNQSCNCSSSFNAGR